MKTFCTKCRAMFDDEFRTTICPHETFAANDGYNNFRHYPESLLLHPPEYITMPKKKQATGGCQVVALCFAFAFIAVAILWGAFHP
jgi:hypothetical protein